MTLPPGALPFVAFYLRRYVRAEDTIVDLGCGPDRYRVAVAPARYIGIDITAMPFGPDRPRRVDVVANAREIPLADSRIDFVFSVSAFYQFPDTLAVLKEVRRILKPGGRVLIFDYNRRTQRILAVKESHALPCWTQRQLRKYLVRAGFVDCQVLAPRVARPISSLEWYARITLEELLGTWAVVYGQKPEIPA